MRQNVVVDWLQYLLADVVCYIDIDASKVLRPARHIIGHFGDESLQDITCTSTDNSKQTREPTPKTGKNTKQTNRI